MCQTVPEKIQVLDVWRCSGPNSSSTQVDDRPNTANPVVPPAIERSGLPRQGQYHPWPDTVPAAELAKNKGNEQRINPEPLGPHSNHSTNPSIQIATDPALPQTNQLRFSPETSSISANVSRNNQRKFSQKTSELRTIVMVSAAFPPSCQPHDHVNHPSSNSWEVEQFGNV